MNRGAEERAKQARIILRSNTRPDPEAKKRRELSYTERVKLFSAWLNGIAIATFAVGGIAPTVQVVSSDTGRMSITLINVVLGSVLVSMVLHMMARKILRRLE